MSRVYINLVGEFYSLTPTDWRWLVAAVCAGADYTPLVIRFGRRLSRSPSPWLYAIHNLYEWSADDWADERERKA
jgi:hypothetical protein